jgi:hypothetical protein
MLKITLVVLFPLLLLFAGGWQISQTGEKQPQRQGNTGTLEKMIVEQGTVNMDVDLKRLGSSRLRSQGLSSLRFDVEPNAFFTVLVFNDELRGPLPSSMPLIPTATASLPGKLASSFRQLNIENLSWGEQFDLVVRDARSGFVFFNIEGQEYDYEPVNHSLSIKSGRLLLSGEYADELGRPSDKGQEVGKISINATMRPIEITQFVDGEPKSDQLVASPQTGTVPGPDVVVGDLNGLAQFGTADGTKVGLAVGTDSCNFGTVNLNWFALPNNDHPVIPQNLYRMSGGADNAERFEQIGQSSVKHAFTALTQNICSLGCNGTGGSQLGSGCSDPYVASLNAGTNNALGSRAWINPFTGSYPRGDSATPPNNHTGHIHTGPSHRILVESSDLSTSLNTNAAYFAEGQYITPHEYTWCQSNPTQCNMYNNVSYRRYNVIGTQSPFSFSPAAATVRQKTAVTAWTGASFSDFQPAPGTDGIGTVAYKVTNPSPGVWHYEYAIYNQNLDRAIQSFSVPVGAGASVSNIGFHAPPQHGGWTFDGTAGNSGYSSADWSSSIANGTLTWSTETFAQNPNANAIRWGTLYNFRFDSNRPPTTVTGTLGPFKTGSSFTVQVQGPSAAANVSVSGRVATSDGMPVSGAKVTITGPGNFVRSVTTGTFGFYTFENIAPGQTYTISVLSRRYTFTPQTMQINGNLTGVNFSAPVQ